MREDPKPSRSTDSMDKRAPSVSLSTRCVVHGLRHCQPGPSPLNLTRNLTFSPTEEFPALSLDLRPKPSSASMVIGLRHTHPHPLSEEEPVHPLTIALRDHVAPRYPATGGRLGSLTGEESGGIASLTPRGPTDGKGGGGVASLPPDPPLNLSFHWCLIYLFQG